MKKYSDYTKEELIEECANNKIDNIHLFSYISDILIKLKIITDNHNEPLLLKIVENEEYKRKFNLNS